MKIKKSGLFLILLFLISQVANAQAFPEKKSVAGAFFRSLVLPGWGEYYSENYTAAKWTFGAELAVWFSYFYFDYQSSSLEADYKNIALTYAGISSDDRGKQYWIDIGASENIYIHNIEAARNRDKDAIYTDIEEYYWQWTDPGKQADYNHVRVRSVDYGEYAKMTLGGLFLTRLVSTVLAVRGAKRYNREMEGKKGADYGIRFSPKLDSEKKVYMNASLSFRF